MSSVSLGGGACPGSELTTRVHDTAGLCALRFRPVEQRAQGVRARRTRLALRIAIPVCIVGGVESSQADQLPVVCSLA